MMQVTKIKPVHPQYPIERSPLFNLRRKSKLAALLQTSVKALYSLCPDTSYNCFQQVKKDGTPRDISAPNSELKQIQRQLLRLLQRIETPDWLISGKKRKSYADNARFHWDASEAVTIDIRKFYDNCSHKHIYLTYLNDFRMSPDVAHILCQITTREWSLPTGSPTSQLVAFWSYHKVFAQIDAISKKYDCKFSLYVDDMTFSSRHIIPVHALLKDVSSVLHTCGHRVKYSKIEHYSKGTAKLITGVVIDKENQLRVPNSLRHKIITDFRKLKKSDLPPSEKNEICESIIGRIVAARNIEPGIYPEILRFARESIKKI